MKEYEERERRDSEQSVDSEVEAAVANLSANEAAADNTVPAEHSKHTDMYVIEFSHRLISTVWVPNIKVIILGIGVSQVPQH